MNQKLFIGVFTALTVLQLLCLQGVSVAAIQNQQHTKFTPEDIDLEHLVSPKFSSDWAVEVTGGSSVADKIAGQHGFINLGQIGNLKTFYHFKLIQQSGTGSFNTSGHGLQDDLVYRQRETEKRSLGNSLREITKQSHLTHALKQTSGVGFVEQQRIVKHAKMEVYSSPSDSLWPNQWSLLNLGQTWGPKGKDINVEPVWMQGVTGRGVVVAFIDNGLEIRHPDLVANYDSQASWDFVDEDEDPTPDNYFGDDPDSHGTSCAGQVGMTKNNGRCGVGIAHNSHIGGLKIDYDFLTDLIKADALGHKNSYIDIYSNSWGPNDHGFTVDGPRILTQRTLENGVTQGRNGKGVIYTFAGGNGGKNLDSCATDGYASSIYTIAVGSADQDGMQAFYDEQCAAKMVVTFAFNSNTWAFSGDKQITTTTLNGDCTDTFTGTSASTPHVSGVIALALQVNPNLSWRDVQYLVVYTSNPYSLRDGEWTTNGGGLKVSHKFGFGALDAEAFVTRARRWIGVPEQQSESFYPTETYGTSSVGNSLITTFDVTTTNIAFLEHVVLTASLTVNHGYDEGLSYSDFQELRDIGYSTSEIIEELLSLHYPKRGDIQMELISPHGTVSILLPYRTNDFINEEGYDSWPFMSVHHWGENPIGRWTVKVDFKSLSGSVSVRDLKLTLYGTSDTPQAVRNIPTTCNAACARGCSGLTTLDCDACREYRISSTLDCVSTCPQGTHTHNGYCLDGSTTHPGELSNKDIIIPSTEFGQDGDHSDEAADSSSENNGHDNDNLCSTCSTHDESMNDYPSVKAILVLGCGIGVLILCVALFIVVISVAVFHCRNKRSNYKRQGFSRLHSDTVEVKPTAV